MTRKAYIVSKAQRWVKCLLMLVGIACMVYAYRMGDVTYYANGSNSYDRLVSVFCTIITELVFWEYWRDPLLRLVAMTAFLGCLNMATDEFFFNPTAVQANEEWAGMIMAGAFVFNIFNLLADGRKPAEAEL